MWVPSRTRHHGHDLRVKTSTREVSRTTSGPLHDLHRSDQGLWLGQVLWQVLHKIRCLDKFVKIVESFWHWRLYFRHMWPYLCFSDWSLLILPNSSVTREIRRVDGSVSPSGKVSSYHVDAPVVAYLCRKLYQIETFLCSMHCMVSVTHLPLVVCIECILHYF